VPESPHVRRNIAWFGEEQVCFLPANQRFDELDHADCEIAPRRSTVRIHLAPLKRPPLDRRQITATEDAMREFGIADDPYLARVIFAALDGLTLQQFIFEDEGETEKAIARLREIIAAVAATK
jgi:hypothetical protein